MEDLKRLTTTETLYLRKWPGAREDGVMPDEIVVVQTVTPPDEDPVTHQWVVTNPAEIRIVNAQAEEAERKPQVAEENDEIDWQAEVKDLEKRVTKHAPDGASPSPTKLAAYRERLARAKKMADAPKKEQ